jgi:hypothetical protein
MNKSKCYYKLENIQIKHNFTLFFVYNTLPFFPSKHNINILIKNKQAFFKIKNPSTWKT